MAGWRKGRGGCILATKLLLSPVFSLFLRVHLVSFPSRRCTDRHFAFHFSTPGQQWWTGTPVAFWGCTLVNTGVT